MSRPDPLASRVWALLALAAEHRADDAGVLLDDLDRDDVVTVAYGVAHLAVHSLARAGHSIPADGIRAVLLATHPDTEGGTAR
ncbi:hypothetical protein [Streptomyces sp. NPDC057580]|uniref:hypothetical protein n=1 Tax=Streptomyces sp. NPDC057580 TaxID=3346173 RepID=UPI00368C71F8